MATTQKKRRLRAKADKLWQIAVIEEWGDKCEVDGKLSGPPHHFIPKSLSNNLRYDIKNGVPLCVGCHFVHHHKGDPEISIAIVKKRGKKWLNYLKRKRRIKIKATIGWYQENIKRLEKNEE